MAIGDQRFSCKLNKAAFFRDVGYTPHRGQIPIHASRAPRRIVVCGVRFGKSVCAAMEGLAAAMEPATRSMGWVVAPTYDLADKVFREIVYVAHDKLRSRVIKVQESAKVLHLRNTAGGVSEIRAKSADNPVSLLGEGLDWLVVDEAARLKPHIWEGYLSQRLIDKKGWALLISTPKGKGFFFDLFRAGQRGLAQFESWNCPSTTNPHLDADLIEAERLRLPERVFRQEYMAEFVEGAGAVFRRVREAATGKWRDPKHDRLYYAGLDLAKVEDYSVLVVMDSEYRVVFVDRFNRLDWPTQIARVRASVERWGDARVLVDTTGAGEPVFEAMQGEGMYVDPYPFTARSKQDIVNHLAILFEQGRIEIPEPRLWPEGVEELEAFEYAVSDSGHVKTGAPSGYHDDCVMALALAAWQVNCRGNRDYLWVG